MIWNCRDKKIECENKTLIMGIVNVTPDSFSDGGKWADSESAVAHALDLISEGADIIDLGAQSTRPNYVEISADEEFARLHPVIKALREKCDVPISVDTYFPSVAERCLEMGVDIINDVSGVISNEMADVVKKYNAGWVVMHNGDGGISEVSAFFKNSLAQIEALGISRGQICLDMGIGFGKTRKQDLELIANVEKYRIKDVPILLGTSRKRVIGEFSGQENPAERVYGNISADTIAILGGANIIRLHDVKNEIQGILMAQALKGHKANG